MENNQNTAFNADCKMPFEKVKKSMKDFLATLVALHFTPVSKSVGRSVTVSDYCSLELASLFNFIFLCLI